MYSPPNTLFFSLNRPWQRSRGFLCTWRHSRRRLLPPLHLTRRVDRHKSHAAVHAVRVAASGRSNRIRCPRRAEGLPRDIQQRELVAALVRQVPPRGLGDAPLRRKMLRRLVAPALLARRQQRLGVVLEVEEHLRRRIAPFKVLLRRCVEGAADGDVARHTVVAVGAGAHTEGIVDVGLHVHTRVVQPQRREVAAVQRTVLAPELEQLQRLVEATQRLRAEVLGADPRGREVQAVDDRSRRHHLAAVPNALHARRGVHDGAVVVVAERDGVELHGPEAVVDAHTHADAVPQPRVVGRQLHVVLHGEVLVDPVDGTVEPVQPE
eukprot:PhM_4_TR13345/c1_g1_i1/m.69181